MISKKARKDWRAVAGAIWNFWTSQTGAFILAVTGIVVGYYIFYISRPILKYETEKLHLFPRKMIMTMPSKFMTKIIRIYI